MRLVMKLREVLVNHFDPAFQIDEDQDIECSNFYMSLNHIYFNSTSGEGCELSI
jgi:hypothetical protein